MKPQTVIVNEALLTHLERAVEIMKQHLNNPELLKAAQRNDGVGANISQVLEEDAQSRAVLKNWIARVRDKAEEG